MSWLKNLLLVSLSILAPIKAVMLASFALIMIDLITGVWCAVKRKEAVVSSGFRRTISKIVAYELALVAALIMEQYLMSGSIPVIKIVAGLIAVTEGKSVMENLSEITGVDFLKVLVDKIQGISGDKPESGQ